MSSPKSIVYIVDMKNKNKKEMNSYSVLLHFQWTLIIIKGYCWSSLRIYISKVVLICQFHMPRDKQKKK